MRFRCETGDRNLKQQPTTKANKERAMSDEPYKTYLNEAELPKVG